MDQIASLESSPRISAGQSDSLQEELNKKNNLLKAQGNNLDELTDVVAEMEDELEKYKKMSKDYEALQRGVDYEGKCKELENELPDALNKLASATATIELLQEEVINAYARAKQAVGDLESCQVELNEVRIQSSAMGEEADTAQQLLDEATAALKD